jgi:lipid-A-disaccharide synthase
VCALRPALLTMSDSPLVILVAGEASGDQLGAALIEALRERLPAARFAGVGGPQMQAAGFEAWWDISELSVMGLAEVLRHLPRLLSLRRKLAARILAAQPEVLVGIDAPDFNLGLEEAMRRRGIATIHYVSPTVWAWRSGRARRIGRSASLVLCLFPFEPAFYAGHGVAARYTGHPMADRVDMDNPMAPAREALGLPRDTTLVALLPGSRASEVGLLAAPMLEAATRLAAARPGIRFVAPMASARTRALFEAELAQHPGLSCRLVDGQARQVMAAAEVVICASGTATLECMLVKRPMVVVYRVSWMTSVIARSLRLIKSEFVSLPNVLAGEPLVPELIQEQANGEAIAREVNAWLADVERRQNLLERFTQLHRELRCNAAERAAAEVQGLLERNSDAAANA